MQKVKHTACIYLILEIQGWFIVIATKAQSRRSKWFYNVPNFISVRHMRMLHLLPNP